MGNPTQPTVTIAYFSCMSTTARLGATSFAVDRFQAAVIESGVNVGTGVSWRCQQRNLKLGISVLLLRLWIKHRQNGQCRRLSVVIGHLVLCRSGLCAEDSPWLPPFYIQKAVTVREQVNRAELLPS